MSAFWAANAATHATKHGSSGRGTTYAHDGTPQEKHINSNE
jgi:hypothetical protein